MYSLFETHSFKGLIVDDGEDRLMTSVFTLMWLIQVPILKRIPLR